MVPLKNICYHHFKHFNAYDCRLRGQMVVKKALCKKSEIREFCPFKVAYTDPLLMFRIFFLFKILTKYIFLLTVKSHFTVKKKTQPLAYHQTKGTFLTKKGLFSLIVTPTLKGFTIFLLRNKASIKIQQMKLKA